MSLQPGSGAVRRVEQEADRPQKNDRPPPAFQKENPMLARVTLSAALALLIPLSASATARCDAVLAAFGNKLVGATCFDKADLTTNGDSDALQPTTPPDDSIFGLPPGAYRPR